MEVEVNKLHREMGHEAVRILRQTQSYTLCQTNIMNKKIIYEYTETKI